MSFTIEELTNIAHSVNPGAPEVIVHEGLRYTFGQEYDDQSVMEAVANCDCYGKLAWPVTNPMTGREERPAGFTGAARLLGPTPMHDAMWWEPYREGKKVFDSPDETHFIAELLDWGFVGLTLEVERTESCGYWHEVGSESLWGIESPTIGEGNYAHLAEVYSDLIGTLFDDLKTKDRGTS